MSTANPQKHSLDRAKAPATPIDMLRQLAEHPNIDVRIAVACNPSAPEEILQGFAQKPEMQSYVARNLGSSPHLLHSLAQNSNIYIRRDVAENENASKATLEMLAGDPVPYVRRGVAGNPSASASTLRTLLGDEDFDVRYYVARNPTTPLDAVAVLVDDENAVIRAYAKARMKTKTTTLLLNE